MKLSQSHDPNCKFNELTQFFFFLYFMFFFKKKIIIQYLVDWELVFVIYFSFLYVELFQSHD